MKEIKKYQITNLKNIFQIIKNKNDAIVIIDGTLYVEKHTDVYIKYAACFYIIDNSLIIYWVFHGDK